MAKMGSRYTYCTQLFCSHACFIVLSDLTKHKFKDKIIKNFKTTTAQVASPWSQPTLSEKNLDVLEQLLRRMNHWVKNTQIHFQNKRVRADVDVPTFIIPFGLPLATLAADWLNPPGTKILRVSTSSVPSLTSLWELGPHHHRSLTYLQSFWEETENKNGDFLQGTFSLHPRFLPACPRILLGLALGANI